MDEYSSGMDPEVKRYFRRILNSISIGVFWLMTLVGLGLSLGMAIVENGWAWYNYVFYGFAAISFIVFIRILDRIWRKHAKKNQEL